MVLGWFDKKSWRLRRKIKDLQADLREAEREGRFILEDGIFFAELEDMGEMTMLVFGATDVLSAQEESVIRSFFDRNGFTVHRLKIDHTQSHLSEVEIIPPEEMVRYIARLLKGLGFKVVDDSQREIPSNLAAKIVSLSGLVRGITIMFCDHVKNVIATTRVKMNKEGNRLLHWLPRIVENLSAKVSPELLELLRQAFDLAYSRFYSNVGQGSAQSKAGSPSTAVPSAQSRPPSSPIERIPSISFPAKEASSRGELRAPKPSQSPPPSSLPSEIGPPTASLPLVGVTGTPPPDVARAKPPQAVTADDQREVLRLMKDLDAAETVAKMYRKLIKAHPSRCVRNAEGLLEEVQRLFRATATCVLVKVPHGHGVTIHAQAGKKLVWGAEGREGFPVCTSVVADCLRRQKPVATGSEKTAPSESMVLHQIECAAAAPVVLNGNVIGILYVDRREGLSEFDAHDLRALEKVVKVFEEFPDLTLGLL
ncbi:MAG: GAF domain-containing protein [Candidatus Hydrogenedentota bacterium]|nr:MAG: GAF domain-containing protein [Candidatus Hydrogenedentota bacterium]